MKGRGAVRCPAARLAAVMLALVLLGGCAMLQERPGERRFDSGRTRERYQVLRGANTGLLSLKGVGQVALRSPGRMSVSERMAFTAQPPDHMRISVRSMTGFPLLSVAANGEWVTLIEHREGRFLRKPFDSNAFADWTGLAIHPGHLVDLLCGRLPDIDFDQAISVPDGGLLLERQWTGARYRIRLSEDPTPALTVLERFGRDEELKWRCELQGYRWVDGYYLPSDVRFENDDGTVMVLRMNRQEVDEPLDPMMFLLEKPRSAS
ncbi:MAG: hypothetical protein ACOWWM_05535 [Desulfobacterales bacterium]